MSHINRAYKLWRHNNVFPDSQQKESFPESFNSNPLLTGKIMNCSNSHLSIVTRA